MTERGVRAAVDPRLGQVLVEGAPPEIAAMAAWLGGTEDEYRFNLGEIGFGTTRLNLARRAPQRDAPVFIEVAGSCLVIAASSVGFGFLARTFEGFSSWGIGQHLHVEHVLGHPFIGEGSASVVATLV